MKTIFKAIGTVAIVAGSVIGTSKVMKYIDKLKSDNNRLKNSLTNLMDDIINVHTEAFMQNEHCSKLSAATNVHELKERNVDIIQNIAVMNKVGQLYNDFIKYHYPALIRLGIDTHYLGVELEDNMKY